MQEQRPDALTKYLQHRLAQRDREGNLRRLPQPATGIDFWSNDYLGLAAGAAPTGEGTALPCGATGSRLLSGNSQRALDLESFLAAHHNQEAALLFNSGYDANLGLLSVLPDRHTVVLYDAYCHASMLDGIRLSPAKQAFRFRHNSTEDLEQKLRRYAQPGTPVLIALESVYSMEGSIAPLAAITGLAARYGAAVVVDEAHATGIFGTGGTGLVQQLGLEQQVMARVHTFGKALGCHGAAITGSRLLIDYLVNFARSFIYTTALPAQAIDAIARAYRYIGEQPAVVAQLHELVSYFRQQLQERGLRGWCDSTTPIQSLLTGGNAATRSLACRLRSQGISVSAVLSPTVPVGRERLRICLHAFNTRGEIDLLLNLLSSCPNPDL